MRRKEKRNEKNEFLQFSGSGGSGVFTLGLQRNNESGTGASDETTPSSGEATVKLKEITVGIAQDLDDSLDPYLTTAAGTREVMFNVFEGLVKPGFYRQLRMRGGIRLRRNGKRPVLCIYPAGRCGVSQRCRVHTSGRSIFLSNLRRYHSRHSCGSGAFCSGGDLR